MATSSAKSPARDIAPISIRPSRSFSKWGRKTERLPAPLQFQPERAHFKSGELEFPGKVLADTAGQRLFISDTNHHRVVITTFDGRIIDMIGSGAIGLTDGGFAQARLHQPQGLAFAPMEICSISPTRKIMPCGKPIWRRKR